jgi:hypothetical protein
VSCQSQKVVLCPSISTRALCEVQEEDRLHGSIGKLAVTECSTPALYEEMSDEDVDAT